MAKLEVVIDARKAKAGAKEFVDAQEGMRRSAKQSADDIVRSADREAQAQKKKADAAVQAANRAVSSAKESFGKLEKFVGASQGWIGDVGDAVGMLGNDFLGLSVAQQKTLEGTLALTQKGAALGSIFGPLGGLIGGAAGALLGYASASNSAAKETLALAKAEKIKNTELSKGLADIGKSLKSEALAEGIDVFGLSGKSREQLEADYEFIDGLIKDNAQRALIAGEIAEDTVSRRGTSESEVAKAKEDSDKLTRSLSAQRLERAEIKKAIELLNKEEEKFAGTTEVVADGIKKTTSGFSEQTKAVASATEELRKLNEEVLKFMDVGASKPSGTGSVLDDATWLAMQAGNANPDDLIGFMERDAVMQEEKNGGADEDPFSMLELAEKQQTPMNAWLEQYDQLADAQKEFEEILVGSFDSIADGLAQTLWGVDVDWRETMRSMGIELTKLLIKMAVAAGLKAVISGATGGIGGALGAGVIGDLIVGGSFHSGGTVGNGGGSPMVAPASLFKGAPRFHGGLAPDEFPAILQTGEQVLSRQQVANGGGGRTINVTNYFPDVRDSRGFNRSIDQNSDRMRRMLRDD